MAGLQDSFKDKYIAGLQDSFKDKYMNRKRLNI